MLFGAYDLTLREVQAICWFTVLDPVRHLTDILSGSAFFDLLVCAVENRNAAE